MKLPTTLGKVLVLDGDMIPALTIVRSLSKAGLIVHLACHLNRPLAGFSRHAKSILTYPDPLTCESEFLSWCKSIMLDGDYRLIIPVTERTLIPMQQLRAHTGADKLAMASNDALAVALDKGHTMKLAAELGISTPRSSLIETNEQAAQNTTNFKTPVVIKPNRSIGMDKTARKRLSVEYAYNPEELAAKVEHFLNYGPVLLQEYIQGQGVGLELIADQGEVIYAFQHLRLHEVPLSGGGSSLRVSVPIEPRLMSAAKKLMKALSWHGVAMVEFKWNSSNSTYSLMEINGRFWGSLPLADAAGADFPVMLYELLVDGGIKKHPAPKLGIYSRKLSSDIFWYEQILRRDVPPGFKDFPSLTTMLKDQLLIFSPRHHFDVQKWRDPIPGFVDLYRISQDYIDRFKRLLHSRRALRSQSKAWSDGRVLQKLHTANQLLFLCYGNINRSALAERYLLSIMPRIPTKITSAGFHEEEGRPADPVMVEVAGKAAIDMNNWKSRRVTRQMIAESNIILAMELRHYERLVSEFPEAAQKTFLLGMAASGAVPDGEIPDPYGHPRTAYERCVRQVTTSVGELAKLLTATIQ